MLSMTARDRLSRAGEPSPASALAASSAARAIERGVEFDGEARAVVLHQREFLLGIGARLVVAHPPLSGPFEQTDRRGEPRQGQLQSVEGGFASIHCDALFTRCLNDSQRRHPNCGRDDDGLGTCLEPARAVGARKCRSAQG